MSKVLLVLRHTKEQFQNDSKYQGICQAFISLGYEVFRTYIDKDKVYITDGTNIQVIGDLLLHKSWTKNTSLFIAVKHFVQQNNFEYCYIRAVPTTLSYISMLKTIRRSRCRIMVEIPTYPVKGEFESDRNVRKILRSVLFKIEKSSAKYVDAYLLMGEKADNYLGTPAVNIENGVDIRLFTKREYKKTGDINLVFIGKVARWHGVDRIIYGLYEYYKTNSEQKVILHIIGNDADGTLKSCKELSEKLHLSDYIIFEGPKYGLEADELFNISEVAIASLGDHRRKVNNISLLKNKEYMARGIPFVYSMDDNMIDEHWDYCLKVPKDDSPLNIDEVISFATGINQVMVTDEMRLVCRDKMGWDAQIEKAIRFVEEIR